MRFRNKIILRALEATPGTLETLADADAARTRNAAIQMYLGDKVSENLDRDGLGNDEEVNVNPHTGFSYEIPLAGSGATATAPAWGIDLQGCAMAETDDTIANDEWYYTPVDEDFSALSLRFRRAEVMQNSAGCRGNWRMRFASGDIPLLIVENMLGDYRRAVAATGTPDHSAFLAAIPVTKVNTPVITVDGVQYAVSSYELNGGVQIERVNEVGREETVVAGRRPTGSILVKPTGGAAAIALIAKCETHLGGTPVPILSTHGATAGLTIKTDVAEAAIIDIAEQEVHGEVYYAIAFNILPTSHELKIIHA